MIRLMSITTIQNQLYIVGQLFEFRDFMLYVLN